jgi:hypothetical protein
LHVKVHPVATAVVAVVSPIQHAPALTAWLAVGVAVLAVMAAAVVVVLAAATAVAVVVVLAVVVAAMAAVAAVVHSAVDQQRRKASLAIRPSMVGNRPIIELHLGTAQLTVLCRPAAHSGAPHFE